MHKSKKVFAALLALALVFAFVPTANAVEIQAETPAITPNIGMSTGTVIGFAGEEWWVIGDSASGVYPQPDSVTLLLKSTGTPYGTTAFRTGNNTQDDLSWTQYPGDGQYYEGGFTQPSDYRDSTLQRKMAEVADGFSVKERALINERTLTAAGEGINGADVTDQKLWPLSRDEWHTINDSTVRSFGNSFLLRSPHSHPDFSDYLGNRGFPDGVLFEENTVLYNIYAVRPAFNLNLEDVIFTSAAAGGKSTATAGSGFVGKTALAAGTVKFTMQDASQTLDVTATKEQAVQSGATLDFGYRNATTGTNQYVSAVLTEGGDEVAYYGKLADSSATASGALSVPLSGVADGTYTLKFFSEEANGDNLTDFCSAPVTARLEVTGGTGTVIKFGGTILSDDAGLSGVAGRTVTAGNEAGTGGDPITAAVTVPYGKSSIAATDLTPTDAGAAVSLYSDSNFSTEGTVTLTDGGTSDADTDIYVRVTASDTTTALHYKITVTRVASDAPVITPRTLPDGMAGVRYSNPVIYLSGDIPYTGRQIAAGALPGGLSIDNTTNGSSGTIIIEGTPTVPGTFTFAIAVTNGGKTSAPVEFRITILPDDRETVSFGGREWLVIADGTSGVAPVTDTLTLLSKNDVFGTSQFHSSSSKYDGSTLQASMETALNNLNLSSAERGLIKTRTLTGSGAVYSIGTDMAGDNAENQEFWPLSYGEWNQLPSNYYRACATSWWLRSPGSLDDFALYGVVSGSVTSFDDVHNPRALRPAFHLDLSSVLFTSAAAGGKSGPAGAGLSAAQPASPYKFTMEDNSIAPAFALGSVTNAGGALTVHYTGAAYVGGETRTVSAIVKDSGGDVTYYGKLKNITGAGDESGTAAVTLPGGFDPAADTLHIFVEQHNDGNYTDFAGTLHPITIPGDTELIGVAGQAITPGSETGTDSEPITAAVTVANSIGSIAPGDITAAAGATAELYSDAAFSQNKDQPISLTVGGGNHLYIKVTAADHATVVYYDVTVTRQAPVPAAINPTSAVFDKNTASADHRDIPVTLSPGSYTLSAITHGGDTLLAGTDYTVNGNIYTIKKEYLAALNTGAQAITFDMSGGADPALTVTVTDTTPPVLTDAAIAPASAAFDKNTASADHRDIPVTLSPGSYTLSAIKHGGNTLQAGTDYTVSGSVYTIKKEYLATLNTGAQAITFDMSGGVGPVLAVTVTDTTPPPVLTDAAINPTSAMFDKNTASADYRDIPVTLSPGSYTLSAITHGGTAFAAGTDYTVSGNTYTIKKKYLAALNTGAQAITFDMSGGVDPVLAVTVTDTTPPPYPVIRHFGTWTGGDVSIGSIDGPFGDFVRLIRLDNNTVVAPSNYTVTSGSTVITLHESYLKTFANGPYAFRAEFTNGYADLTLTVNAGAGDSGAAAATGAPPTGDDGSSLDVWIALCVAAGAGIAGILLWRRRRQTKEPR